MKRGRPRLSPSIESKICQMFSSGVSQAKIALELSVSRRTVRRVIDRVPMQPANFAHTCRGFYGQVESSNSEGVPA